MVLQYSKSNREFLDCNIKPFEKTLCMATFMRNARLVSIRLVFSNRVNVKGSMIVHQPHSEVNSLQLISQQPLIVYDNSEQCLQHVNRKPCSPVTIIP